VSKKQPSVESPKTKSALLKLVKKYGEAKKIEWVRTGIHALDLILGGGFPMRRIIELYGTESAGKSTLGWQLAKVFQENGGVVIFMDMESTEASENAKKLGVDIDLVFRPEPMPETVEQVRDSLVATVNDIREAAPDAPILVLWDTIAATSTIRQWENFDKRQAKDVTMGAVAAALSQYFQEFARWLNTNNVTMLCINQIREKIGVMFGNPETTPGGRALKYYATIRLKLSRGKKLTVSDKVIGFECPATVIKNKCAPMFRDAKLKFLFAEGQAFDRNAGLLEVLEKAGRVRITKAGFKVGEKEYDELPKAIEENPTLLADWIN